jgi:hypothetical protein
VDGLLQSGGRRAAVVHPVAGRRGTAAMGMIQGPPQPSFRSTSPLGAPVRVVGVSPHRDRGGILQQVSGSAAARGSARGGPARPTLHRRPSSPVEPRCPHPQSGDAHRGHESRPSGRADGVGAATSTGRQGSPSCPAPSADAEAAAARPSCTTSGRGPAATGWAAFEAAVPGGTGGTAPSRPLLQLQ